jgi:hypothetical protein
MTTEYEPAHTDDDPTENDEQTVKYLIGLEDDDD